MGSGPEGRAGDPGFEVFGEAVLLRRGPGHIVTVIAPAGLEQFLQEVPERALGEEEVALAAGFGVEILEPPPV